MAGLLIRSLDPVETEILPPDLVWDGIVGDVALATKPDHGPTGGLRAGESIATAILILLFTDARADARELRFEHAGDRRGWVGDAFDVDRGAGETASTGSRLWLFRRRELTDGTAREVADEASSALAPLVDQGVCARVQAEARAMKAEGRIDLDVELFARDGSRVFAARYGVLWSKADGIQRPLAP